jgi:aryl-alcohol dehydrogenase-like predicted oxidoreductase
MIRPGLGTVQLGMPYGNQRDRTIMPMAAAAAILDAALAGGVTFFDTAAAYGESEQRLGEFGLAARGGQIEVSTKIPAVSADVHGSEAAYWRFLTEQIAASRKKLKVDALGLLQFHQHDLAFLEAKHVARCLQRLIDDGLCKSVGISVYEPEQALAALAIPAVSALQVPVNLLDERFIAPRMTAAYKQKQARVIARSILLQGVLVDDAPLPPVKRASELATMREKARAGARRLGGSLHQIGLEFLFGNLRDVIAVGLLGADSADGLKQNLAMVASARPHDGLDAAMAEARAFAVEQRLLNPGQW